MTRDERKQVIDALESLLAQEGELMYFDNYSYLMAIKGAVNELKKLQPDTEVDDSFEPWLPNSRNQRCILPLMNLMLKDDAGGGK